MVTLLGLLLYPSQSPANFLLYGENIPLEFISYLNLVRFLGITISDKSLLPRGNIGQLGIVWDNSKNDNNRLKLNMDIENFSIKSMDNSQNFWELASKSKRTKQKEIYYLKKQRLIYIFQTKKLSPFRSAISTAY